MKTGWKNYTHLLTKKGRLQDQKFIVEGVRLCREAFLSDCEIETAFINEGFESDPYWGDFRGYLDKKKIPFTILRSANFKKLSDTAGARSTTIQHQGPAMAPAGHVVPQSRRRVRARSGDSIMTDVLEQIKQRQQRNRESDRAVRRLVGMTASEFDADTTAGDPSGDDDKSKRLTSCRGQALNEGGGPATAGRQAAGPLLP